MTTTIHAKPADRSVLIVDGDILSRHAIADYLRHCGYAVVEAASTDEAMKALEQASLGVDVIMCDVEAIGEKSGFQLAQWVRNSRAGLEIRLAASVEAAVVTAAELCQIGPHLKRPYEPEAVVDYVRQLRAARAKSEL